jgi:hypothetical protein
MKIFKMNAPLAVTLVLIILIIVLLLSGVLTASYPGKVVHFD